MSPDEKASFKLDLVNADTPEKMHVADARWMRWYVCKFKEGVFRIDPAVQGSQYFGYLAGKINDQAYLEANGDWYWNTCPTW